MRGRVASQSICWIASIKGLIAGAVNLSLAFALSATSPSCRTLSAALTVGLLALIAYEWFVEVSAEFSAKLGAELLKADVKIIVRDSKNWRRERKQYGRARH